MAARTPKRLRLRASTAIPLTGILIAILLSLEASPAIAEPVSVFSDSSLTLSQSNESPRAVVLCPGNKEPYGGTMSATPPPSAEGEGVYPHSYERLGAQSGWHVTPVLFDPTPRSTRSYRVTLQVVCGKKPGKLQDPHAFAYNLKIGESKTLVAKCPKRSVLVGGGFQRAAFEGGGGVFPTESHAISKNKWQVSGTALPGALSTPGGIKTDLASIGYCMRSPKRKPLMSEVSASVSISPREVGALTTPSCPSAERLFYSGFDTEPLQSLFFAGSFFNPDQSLSAWAYNRSGAPATLTGYGYCLPPKVFKLKLKKFTKRGPS